jgi:hypothetical protein
MSKQLISRKALCVLMGISYNELIQQFKNKLSSPPECLGKASNEQLYDREMAIQWVHYWQNGCHKIKAKLPQTRLMMLNVKAIK